MAVGQRPELREDRRAAVAVRLLQRPQRPLAQEARVELEGPRDPVERIRIRRVRDFHLRRRAFEQRAVVAEDLERDAVPRGQSKAAGVDADRRQDRVCELGGGAIGVVGLALEEGLEARVGDDEGEGDILSLDEIGGVSGRQRGAGLPDLFFRFLLWFLISRGGGRSGFFSLLYSETPPSLSNKK